MSDTCPMCGDAMQYNRDGQVSYFCGSWFDVGEGATSGQGQVCKLRCELAEARGQLAKASELAVELAFQMQRAINERDDARARLAEANAAIRWASELLIACFCHEGYICRQHQWSSDPAVKRAKEGA